MRYDTNVLLDKATDLFWQRGFKGAGMRDIQTALDMRPGSIYARFANKDGLFTLVIEHYVSQMQEKLTDVARAADPLDALQAFFHESLSTSPDMRYKRQCLLIKSAAELDALDSAAKRAVTQGMSGMHSGFCEVAGALIRTGKVKGETDVRRIASWLQNQFVGLRTYASLNDDAKTAAVLIEKIRLDLQGEWPAP